MKHLQLSPLPLKFYRKIAFAHWKQNYDPTVSGTLQLIMDPFIEWSKQQEKTGQKIGITAFTLKVLAMALKEVPEARCVYRFGRLYQREQINLSAIILDPKTGQIFSHSVKNVDQLPLLEIQRQIHCASLSSHNKTTVFEKITRWLPVFFLRQVVLIVYFLRYVLNLRLSGLGFTDDPFGAAEVTNIGSLGLEAATIPLLPYLSMPLVVAPGVIKESVIAEAGQVVIKKTMNMSLSFDHRFIDGFHVSKMSLIAKKYFAEPSLLAVDKQ